MQIVIQTYEKSEETQKQHQEESALYQKMVTYNQTIYREQQKGLDNLGEDGAMENFENEMIGVLEIPAMNQDFPIYAGATAEHMSEGVAVMKDTSLPVGGEDTNCVIAGHRGYNTGKIEGVGPRYCPSFEDKIMRFKDKPRHQLFID